jgi:hypothetical protein
MEELNDTTDIFVTTPHGWRFLGYDYCTVKPEQCVIISHAKLDMTELIHFHGYEDFYRFKKYGAVSQWLVDLSKELGITRPAELTPVGVNCNTFYSKPSERLKKWCKYCSIIYFILPLCINNILLPSLLIS